MFAAKEVDLSAIMAEFDFQNYFDKINHLISLGPFFGGDAAATDLKRFKLVRGARYTDPLLDGDSPHVSRKGESRAICPFT